MRLKPEFSLPFMHSCLYSYHREVPHHLHSHLSTMMHLQPLYPRSPPTSPSVTLIPGTRNKNCNIAAQCYRALLDTPGPFNHSTGGDVGGKEVLVLTDKAPGEPSSDVKHTGLSLQREGCVFCPWLRSKSSILNKCSAWSPSKLQCHFQCKTLLRWPYHDPGRNKTSAIFQNGISLFMETWGHCVISWHGA